MQRTRSVNLISFILLVILLVLFHMELFIIGVRIYAGIVPSAEADHLLAQYYRTAGRQNLQYADYFAMRSFSLRLSDLQKSVLSQKSDLNLKIGRHYECGRGVPMDLFKAKFYFEKAQNTVSDSPDKEMKNRVEEALTRINQEIKTNQPPICAKEEDVNFNAGLIGKFNEVLNNKNETKPNSKDKPEMSSGEETNSTKMKPTEKTNRKETR